MIGARPLRLVHRSLLRRGCGHTMSPALRVRLTESATCPSCQIMRHIKAIRDVQKGLETRGGIFSSSHKMRKEGLGPTGTQAKRHKAWTRKWRETKVKIMALLRQFEEALEMCLAEEEKDGAAEVRKALRLWLEVEEEMAKMPGDWVEEDGDEEEGNWEMFEDPEKAGGMAIAGLDEVANVAKDDLNAVENEDGRMVDVDLGDRTEKVKTSPTVDSLDFHDIQKETHDARILATASDDAGLEQPATPEAILSSTTDTSALRSALRKPRTNSLSSDSLASAYNVSFSQLTTHIPRTRTPLPRSPSNAPYPTLHQHNYYTSYSNIDEDYDSPLLSTNNLPKLPRSRHCFQRSSPFYSPGTWSHTDGCEKVDTSFMKYHWNHVEMVWKAEMEMERLELLEGLNVGSWLWVVRWWARRIAEERRDGMVCGGGGVRER